MWASMGFPRSSSQGSPGRKPAAAVDGEAGVDVSRGSSGGAAGAPLDATAVSPASRTGMMKRVEAMSCCSSIQLLFSKPQQSLDGVLDPPVLFSARLDFSHRHDRSKERRQGDDAS
jgi:hypothetical protein